MKLSILGAGRVGSAAAFLVLAEVKPSKLVLYDIAEALVEGEALDLAHAAVALSPETAVLGTTNISGVEDSDFVIITAGKARTTEKSRAELAGTNAPIVASLAKKAGALAPRTVLLVATNPATQMAEIARQNCSNQVIAMDNQLDTSRFKYFISRETGKPLSDVRSSVCGEHGENMQFKVEDELTDGQLARAEKETLEAGPNLISLKSYTCWGIAAHIVAEIKRSIENGSTRMP